MVDEPEVLNQEDVPNEPQEQQEVPETVSKAEYDKLLAEKEAAAGRASAADRHLNQMGYMQTDDGSIVPLQQTPVSPTTQYTPTPEPEEDAQVIIDRFYADPVAFAKEIKQGAVNETLQMVAPFLESLAVSDVSRNTDDWKDIGAEVQQECQKRGMSIIQARQSGNLDLIADAVRYRRGKQAGGNTPQVDAAEQERLARIALASGSGGASGPSPSTVYEFDQAERESLSRFGMSEEDALKLLSGPARIEKKEAKK